MTKKIHQLFQEELEQLAQIKSICHGQQYQQNELMTHYTKMAAAFEKNLQSMMKMTRISDSQQLYLQDIQQELEREIAERAKAEKKLADFYKRYRQNQFLIDLAEGSSVFDEAAWNTARQLTLSIPAKFQAYYLQLTDWRDVPFSRDAVNTTEVQASLDTILDKLNMSPTVLAWGWGEGIAILNAVSADETREQHIAAGLALKKQALNSFPHIGIAVGTAGQTGGADSFSRHCQQARAAVQLGHRLWPGQDIYHYNDGQVYQLLHAMSGSQEATEFLEKTVGKLQDYDRKNNTELMVTLATILKAANLKAAAEEMFIHHKTMVSRKQRIESILGISLDAANVQFNISLALRLLQIRNS